MTSLQCFKWLDDSALLSPTTNLVQAALLRTELRNVFKVVVGPDHKLSLSEVGFMGGALLYFHLLRAHCCHFILSLNIGSQ